MNSTPLRLAFALACAALAACSSEPRQAEAPPQIARSTSALLVNGGFESSAIGASPDSWSVTTGLNRNLAAVPPRSMADLNLQAGGVLTTQVVGNATVESQPDADLGATASFRYPKFGARSAVVNTGAAGAQNNANTMRQTMTLDAGDIDPADGQIHIRFVAAPVLQNPGHPVEQQPYFFIQVRNVTRNTTLYTNFNFAGQAGVPWKTVNGIQYTDWQLVDVAPGAGAAAGEQVEISVTAAGCSQGGHWGRVYLDAFGPSIPGLFVSGSGPRGAYNDTDITYTLSYKNGGTADAANARVQFVTPPNTVFRSTTGGSCVTPVVNATGTVNCGVGTVAAGASGTFTVTVHVNAGYIGAVTASNYWSEATGISPLLGSEMETTISGLPTSISAFSGTPQSRTVRLGFTSPLVAIVKDSSGNPVANHPVTLTVPGSGASATLNLMSGNTDLDGKFTVIATANSIAGGPYSVTATAGGIATPTSFSLTNTPGAPASISLVDATGTPQTATVGTAFARPLVVLVRDADGNPIPNATVVRTVPGSGASVTFTGPAVTDASGQVSLAATANGAAGGPYTVSLSVAGVATPVSFSLTNAVGAPSAITVVSGSPQSATVGTAFAQPLVARVRDTFNNPVPNVAVSFAVPGSGPTATLGAAPATTDASGLISVSATANTLSGAAYAVTATAAGVAAPASFGLTNAAGAATSISGVTGSPQSTPVTAAFPQALVAVVRDSYGNPVPGAAVTFAAPGAGASASFSGSLTTNASGQVSITATANNVAGGPYAVNATVAGVGPAAAFFLTNTSAAAASVTVAGGGTQSTRVATAFAQSLSVLVRDAFGNPVPGATVAFAAPGSGASAGLGAPSALTNASGVASVSATANTVAGAYAVSATVAGAGTPASFALTNTAGLAAQLARVSGSPQSAAVQASFAAPLVVEVKDTYGNVVPGVAVSFGAPAAGASASITGTLTTDAAGRVSAAASANTVAGGPYTVNASVSGVATPAAFTLTNTAGAPASIAQVGGGTQSAPVTTAFAQALLVEVRDSYGNLVPGASVSFAAPGTGASATLAVSPAITAANGRASVSATANTSAGAYAVTASVSGASTPATFNLTNTAAAAASIARVGGSPQSTRVTTAFASPLVVEVRDVHGNPVPGAAVSFTAPAAGASASFTGTLSTDASGRVSVTATANTVSGAYTVDAGVSGAATNASFALTNTPGLPASVAVAGGSSQSATVDTLFAQQLVAKVTDAHGNVVPGASVAFAAPGAGASALLPASATTDAAGEARVTAKANTVAGGPFTVDASVSGVAAPASFSLTNTAGAPASIALAGGSPQSAVVTSAFASALEVEVRDVFGNRVPGASVAFAAPSADASAVLGSLSATTGTDGRASVTATANTVAGSYAVNASVGGAATNAVFALRNTSGAPAEVSLVSGSPQSTTVQTDFAAPLVVKVTDAHGNLVPDAAVSFSAPLSGASASFLGTLTTDASGQVSVTASANTVAGGPFTVSVTVAGVLAPVDFALTNTADAPASIAQVGGGTQSTRVTTAFADALEVEVRDTFGNLVSGASVGFAAPGDGASASLVGSAATTGTDGRASVTATANTVTGAYEVNAAVMGVATRATFALSNTAADAASIARLGGSPQSTRVTTAFAEQLVVEVRDAHGNLVPGAAVGFTAPSTGASASFSGTLLTGADGRVSVTATANTVTGAYAVQAEVAGVSASADFALTNTPGLPASVAVSGGASQSTEVDSAFADALVATVTDAHGNVVPDATVSFSAPGTGASAVLAGSATTDAAGEARVSATANTVAGGPYTVNAAVSGVATPATFALTNTAGAPASVAVTGGDAQSTVVATAFALPLEVEVRDVHGNLVPDASVAFSAPASSASATFTGAPATTGSNGRASVSAAANTVMGSYPVRASVSGVTDDAVFALTNTPAAAANIRVAGGGAQSAEVGTAYAEPLLVQVTDAHGNAITHARVTFAAPSSGARAVLSAQTVSTDAAGEAHVTAVADTLAGSFQVSATLEGVATPASFELTNTAGAAVSLRVRSGSGQSAVVGTAFALPLTVSVLDGYENPVYGAQVSWSAPAQGASAQLASASSTSDAAGEASVGATANASSGSFLVTASLAGGQQASLLLSNVAEASVAIAVESGSPQAASVGSAFAAPLVVRVTRGGGPLANALVSFEAPSAGASATLGAVLVRTDAAGLAQVYATANALSGSYSVSASVAGSTQPARFALSNGAGAPASIAAGPGSTPQTARMGRGYAAALVAIVLDAQGNPVAGVPVSFAVQGGSPLVTLDVSAPVVTDADGQARVRATAGATAGTQVVTARAPGVLGTASFVLSASGAEPLSLSLVSGSPQSAPVGTGFAAPLVAKVLDSQGAPVAGVVVGFAAPASGATAHLSVSSAVTDAAGEVRVDATAGTLAGRYEVVATAASASAPVRFQLANRAGAAVAMTAAASSSPQSTRIGTAFAQPLSVRLVDAFGNAVPGATVRFAAPASEPTASLSGVDVVTDAQGTASVVAIARLRAGSYTVSAASMGVSMDALLRLTNLPADPALISVSTGSGQTTLATTAYPQATVVTVTDAQGNRTPGAQVRWTVPASGPSATAASMSAVTDDNGEVRVAFTANAVPGSFQATLSVDGGASPVQAGFTIAAIPTRLALHTTPEAPSTDTAVTLTATVSSEHGTPTGVVRFSVGGKALGTGTLSDGVARLSLPLPSLGDSALEAHYDAQGSFGASSATGGLSVDHDTGLLDGGGGCSSAGGSGTGALGVLLSLVAGALRRKGRARASVLGALALVPVLAPALAQAQSQGTAVDVLRSAPAGSDWFSTDSLDLRGHLRPTGRLTLDYAKDPLVLYNPDGTRRSVVLSHQTFMHLGLGLTLKDRVRVSANLPFALSQTPRQTLFDGVQVAPGARSGLGDVGLGADVRLLGHYDELLTLAAGVGLTLPTGSQGNDLGEGSVTIAPRLSLAGRLGQGVYAAHLSYATRAGRIGPVVYGDELRFGASAGVRLLGDKLLVGPELHGLTEVGSKEGPERPRGVEVHFGAHYQVSSSWRVGVGAGPSWLRSAGFPRYRGLATLEWTPSRSGALSLPVLPPKASPLAPPVVQAQVQDADADGVADAQDVCPQVAVGATPDAARPGCPDADPDRDQVLGAADLCPAVAAGLVPDPARAGCPLPDRDADRVADAQDLCPAVPAGFLPDTARPGCPASDKDGDMVADAQDACPAIAGAVSADPRRNGCPGLVVVKGSQLVLLRPVNFATNRDLILSPSFAVLKAVADTLKANPGLRRVAIEGHTDSQGSAAENLELSKRRSASVTRWLIEAGIEAYRLESEGYGATRPISDNVTPRGRATNRRVDFRIVE